MYGRAGAAVEGIQRAPFDSQLERGLCYG